MKYIINTSSEVEGQGKIMDMSMGLAYTTTSKNDTTFSIDMLFKSFKIDMEMMGIVYDSSKESDDETSKEMEQELKPLYETPTKIVVNTSGKIVGSTNALTDNELVGQMSLDNFAIAFPNKAIGIGDSWENEVHLGLMNRKINMKYTYAEKTNEGHKFDLDFDMEDKGTFSGYVLVDPITHLVNSSHVELLNPTVQMKVVSSSQRTH